MICGHRKVILADIRSPPKGEVVITSAKGHFHGGFDLSQVVYSGKPLGFDYRDRVSATICAKSIYEAMENRLASGGEVRTMRAHRRGRCCERRV